MLLTMSATPALAQGQPMDARTEFTFNQPVELPGVTLPPGTYIFRFVDGTTGRKVMQVQAKDASSKTYGMFMTINAQRPTSVRRRRAAVPGNTCRTAGGGEDLVVSRQHDRPRIHLPEIAGRPSREGDESDGADDSGGERHQRPDADGRSRVCLAERPGHAVDRRAVG